jgi:hypothetical protein
LAGGGDPRRQTVVRLRTELIVRFVLHYVHIVSKNVILSGNRLRIIKVYCIVLSL